MFHAIIEIAVQVHREMLEKQRAEEEEGCEQNISKALQERATEAVERQRLRRALEKVQQPGEWEVRGLKVQRRRLTVRVAWTEKWWWW